VRARHPPGFEGIMILPVALDRATGVTSTPVGEKGRSAFLDEAQDVGLQK
jgi:hypothetical protein